LTPFILTASAVNAKRLVQRRAQIVAGYGENGAAHLPARAGASSAQFVRREAWSALYQSGPNAANRARFYSSLKAHRTGDGVDRLFDQQGRLVSRDARDDLDGQIEKLLNAPGRAPGTGGA
jgi:hypothetical protein